MHDLLHAGVAVVAVARPNPKFAFPRAWRPRLPWSWHLRYLSEIVGLLGIVTAVGCVLPLDYHPLGHLYLLAVIVISLRTPLRYAVSTAVLSAIAWDYIFIPPKMSFAVIDFDGWLLLGTYLFSAVLGSQLTARLQEERRSQENREQQARSLLDLAEALSQAHTLEEIVKTAVAKTDDLFRARSAVFLSDGQELRWQPGSSLAMGQKMSTAVLREQPFAFAPYFREQCAYVNLNRCGESSGVLVLMIQKSPSSFRTIDQALMQGVAAQIALALERERVQQQTRREALFAESEKMHRVLLNSVSHELKTPLAVLRTAAEKLPHSDAARSDLLHGEIRVAMTRLDGLVANLLTQSRIQSGRLEAELDWCDLRDVLFAVRRAVEPLLAQHTLITQIPEEFPLVFADGHLLEEVIYNLVNNAVRHTPPGSAITLSAWDDDARIGILVEDNGPGLDPAYAREVFLPFRRGKAARAGGVGLGLSIVQGLMLAQQGGAEYSRAPGGGAIFKIWIPRKKLESIPPDDA